MDARRLHTLGIAAGRALDGYGSGQLGDVNSFVLDKTGAPACGKDPVAQKTEDCQKQMWDWSVKNTCAAATLGAGSTLPICTGGGKALAAITWPLVKYVMMPLAEGLGNAIMALIPDAWTARAVMDPGWELYVMWQGGENNLAKNTGPIAVLWKKSVESIKTAWDHARQEKGLSPSEVRISSKTIGKVFNAIYPPSTVIDLNVAKEWWMNAEDAFVLTCRLDETPGSGWGTTIHSIGYHNGVNGWVFLGAWNNGPVLDVFQGKGAFAPTKLLNWEGSNTDSAARSFRACLTTVWNGRIVCIARQLPTMMAIVSAQVEIDAKGSSSLLNTTTKLAVLGGVGYAAWRYWPQILSYGTKLLRKL